MNPSPRQATVSIRRPGLHAWLDASHPQAAAIEARIPEIAAIPTHFTPVPTRSRSRRIWEGHLDGIPFPVIVKQGWVDPSYPLDRRIARRVRLACHNPFRHAIDVAIQLEAIGFPAPRPILCWKKGPRLAPVEEGILYPKLEASGVFRRYLHDSATDIPFDRRLHLPPETLAALGRYLRSLNVAGFVHLDPTPKNILFRPGAADPPPEEDFILIDVEAFRPLRSARPDTPFARCARAMAIAPLLPYLLPADLPLFAGHFALPSEPPSAWIRIFEWLHRHPATSPLAKLRLFFQTLAFRP